MATISSTFTHPRRLATFLAAIMLALAAGSATAQAAPGDLDPTFASGGILSGAPGAIEIRGLTVQPDGKVLVLETGNDTKSYERVLRFLPDGTPDPSFGTNGAAEPVVAPDVWVRALGLQPDGKILIAGYDSVQDFAVVRLLPDGSLDTSFDGDSGTANGVVHTKLTDLWDDPAAVGVDKQGRIVLAGSAGHDVGIARYLADGKLDTSFAGDGTLLEITPASEHVSALAILDDGLLVAGASGSDTFLARYTDQGAPASGFGTLGRVVMDASPGGVDSADSLVVEPSGRIVVGVPVSDPIKVVPHRLVGLTAAGALDPAFPNGGNLALDLHVNALALAPDGTLAVAGWGILNDDDAFAVQRRSADGAADPTFAGGATVLTRPPGGPFCFADYVATAPDGKLVLAGISHDPVQGDRLMVARYLSAPDAPAGGPSGETPPPPAGGPTPGVPALDLVNLRLTRRTFAAGRAATPRAGHAHAAASRKRGTAFLFTLNRAATVTIRITRLHHTTGAVTLRRSAAAGLDRVRFSGRIGRRTLRPERYRATVRAVDATGARSTPRSVTFRVVHG